MVYAIKAEVVDGRAKCFRFAAHKTMYGGKHIAPGDTVFLFASETQGGNGLVARGTVTAAERVAKMQRIERQTPRVSVTVERTALVRRHLGLDDLKPFKNFGDGRPESELNFKFYRQSTNKIVGISDGAAAFLEGYF